MVLLSSVNPITGVLSDMANVPFLKKVEKKVENFPFYTVVFIWSTDPIKGVLSDMANVPFPSCDGFWVYS